MIKRGVEKALDELHKACPGRFVSLHVKQMRSFAPDCSRSVAGLIATSEGEVFKEECTALLGLPRTVDLPSIQTGFQEKLLHFVGPEKEVRPEGSKETVWKKRLKCSGTLKEVLENGTLTKKFDKFSSYGGRRAGGASKSLPELDEVKKIHALMLERGTGLQRFEANTLIDMYVKCGSMVDARHVFESMLNRSVVSWNSIILGYAKEEDGEVALQLYARMQKEGFTPNDRTFVGALKACSSLAALEDGADEDAFLKIGCLEKGKAIHSRVVKGGFESDVFVGTTLMDVYANCGSMVDAQLVFDKLPHCNVVSWNVLVSGYAEKLKGDVALQLYAQMQQEGVAPNGRTFVGALKACSSQAALEETKEVDGKFLKAKCLEKGRSIHSQVVESSLESDIFLGTSLLDMYAKCGSMADARHVFDKLPHHDVVSCNAMILGYAENQDGEGGLHLYAQMRQEGIVPNFRTFVGASKACGILAALEEGMQVDGDFVKVGCLEKGRSIHSEVLNSGLESNFFVGNTLLDMYAKSGSIMDARDTFNKLPHRTVVSWNAMILAYAEKQEGEEALQLYEWMQQEGIAPDDRTFVSVLKACSSLAAEEEVTEVEGIFVKIANLEKGRAIHSQVLDSGFESDVYVGTSLVDMYAKCGSMVDARHVFDKLPYRNVVSWNALILGYAHTQEGGEAALQLFAQMQEEGVVPNGRTFVGALKACSSLAAVEEGAEVDGKIVKVQSLRKGRAIHSLLVKCDFNLNAYVGTSLVDMYAKCGSIWDARLVFDKLSHRDVVLWNAIILGHAEQRESEEAFKLYAQMQQQSLSADSYTFVGILKACGNTAALEAGKEIHAHIRRVGLETTAVVSSSLIDMYGKCGSMEDAQKLFDASSTRDLVTWNALIAGYSRQGDSDVVFSLFDRMKLESIQPDEITFRSIITVCSYVGLVDEGQKYFEMMSNDFGITPTIEHYTCMVDLLGRAGQLDRAVKMIEEMPFQPNLVMWRCVLGACRKWKNVDVGRHAFACAVGLDEKNAASYVLMSNIYAEAQMWKDRDEIQEMKKKARAWKMPGQSWWTDHGGVVHTFGVGDVKHPQSKDIRARLKDLSVKMEEEGYVPDVDSVLWDISYDEKEDLLCGHSERLAIACALLKTTPDTTIRIVKNLRICDDCHKVTTLISKIEKRYIICRDSSRFHHFKDGKCSCGGYW